jgi:2-polyprenyl-3-methyl-5-hydroxy-6-metoxy-1,4-benzoquinol methylase
LVILNRHSLYTNQGNATILQFLEEGDRSILDIGCGAGDTGKLIRSVYPEVSITGITCSQIEYQQAVQKLDFCICMDIEQGVLPVLSDQKFDVLIFSHVLEHLLDPVAAIKKLLPLLKVGGKVIIALPNIANWRERIKLASGNFEYTDSGVMDRTHIHFYTFHTAPRYLLEPIPELKLEDHLVHGSIPLAFFRHQLLSQKFKKQLDNLGCRLIPNLFGREILMRAIKVN